MTMRQKIERNQATLRFYSATGELAPQQQAAFDAMLPAKRERNPRLDAPHKPLEREVLKSIVQALRLHPRVVKVTRFNSGGSMHRGADGRDHLVLFSSEPVPDLHIMLRAPAAWGWLEVKRPGWSKPTDAREERQAAFLASVREAGGIGCFVRSIDEALEAIAS